MVQQIKSDTQQSIKYPDSDGQPMADNTLQFQWIVTIKENLELLFADHPDVFVAGDLLWYPKEGDNKTRRAPDVMVIFGRPKGYRGSYKQWVENNIAPQVVFEIFSPGNRFLEMELKRRFYESYGVEEYYLYNPQENDLAGWFATEQGFEVIKSIGQWKSPRLGIQVELTEDNLVIFRPDGKPFVSFQELDQQRKLAEEERQLAQEQRQLAEEKRQLAEQEKQQAEVKFKQEQELRQAAEEKLIKLQAKMQELGIDLGEN